MERNLNRYIDRVSRVASEKPVTVPSSRPSERDVVVSVIVRTRNRPDALRLALNSLAWQTFRAFEVVVVNDGGVDVTDVLSEYAGLLQTRYVTNQPAHGQAAALNDGIAVATGQYIAYLDDDDLVYPFHLATLVEAADVQNGRVPFVFSHYNRALVSGTGKEARVVERKRPPLWSFDRHELLVRNHPAQHTWLHSRECYELVGGFDTDYAILQDWDFLLNVTEHVPLTPVHRETCEYRIYADLANSVTSRAVALVDLMRIYERHPASSKTVEHERKREAELLEEQVELVGDLMHSVEQGTVTPAEARKAMLSTIFGFAADIRVQDEPRDLPNPESVLSLDRG